MKLNLAKKSFCTNIIMSSLGPLQLNSVYKQEWIQAGLCRPADNSLSQSSKSSANQSWIEQTSDF